MLEKRWVTTIEAQTLELEPTVTLVVNAGSLEFTVDYVVDYTKRSAMKDRLFTKVVEEVANSKGRLEWA